MSIELDPDRTLFCLVRRSFAEPFSAKAAGQPTLYAVGSPRAGLGVCDSSPRLPPTHMAAEPLPPAVEALYLSLPISQLSGSLSKPADPAAEESPGPVTQAVAQTRL